MKGVCDGGMEGRNGESSLGGKRCYILKGDKLLNNNYMYG